MDEQDGSKTLVIYHAACNDGFCAAWCARKAHPNAQFYPAMHGQMPPDVTGRDVFILDFAYKRKTLLEMKAKAKSITVIDHHKTAAEDLKGLAFCIFDMSKSGASLAWNYFCKGEAPWIVSYTEDRDLNKWNLPFSREINAAMNSYPFDFKAWDALERIYPTAQITNSPLVAEGKTVLRFQERLIESILNHAKPVILDGHKVMAANTSCIFSEVANRLAQENLFGVAWYKREDGKFVHSLRSKQLPKDDPMYVDVSSIAASHGGGGHPHSAGFETTEMILQEV
jgi:oligoribonuclease NrnB/cAMP/cGMP phosphodiesterase (DHH superfamily)